MECEQQQDKKWCRWTAYAVIYKQCDY